GFTVTTENADVRVKENEGVDLTCSFSADFSPNPRVEWKFKNLKGSQVYVIFNGKSTESYANRASMYGSNLRFTKVTRNDNGAYDCEVSGNGQFGERRVNLTVLVPPSPPVCRIPTSVTTGNRVTLSCHDADGSPPSSYRWYKGTTLLPAEPSKIAAFKNATYRLNTALGTLEFPMAEKVDSGQYMCEAYNEAGPPQRCKSITMEVCDINTGGIVAGVIVALLLLALLVFGIWFANKKGYLPSEFSTLKPCSSGDGCCVCFQGDFKQKSSFVV
uniref:Junctional adhesion molecule A n=1 Tax=Mola mola TaxID=94237 RepID=A0A3Q4BMJ4_MOLML